MRTQLATLAFYAKYDGWQSFHHSMKGTIKKLEKKGFLIVEWQSNQARFTGKIFA